MATDYRASNTLLDKIKEFEGLRLTAYRCPSGIWTIGYGHTKGVRRGMAISRKQAETLLNGDLLPIEQYVNRLGVCRTQGQFDAMVDFAFNLGTTRLANSTLLTLVRSSAKTEKIQGEFRKWVFADGKKMPGLVTRREWEAMRWAE